MKQWYRIELYKDVYSSGNKPTRVVCIERQYTSMGRAMATATRIRNQYQKENPGNKLIRFVSQL